MESETLGFEIQKKGEGIRNPGFPVPPTRILESSTWIPELTVWNPESKTVLDYLTRGKRGKNFTKEEDITVETLLSEHPC